jgi:hypothetical protein
MNNPYNRLFLAVWIWQNNKGYLGGAAVLWVKDEDSIISVLKAVSLPLPNQVLSSGTTTACCQGWNHGQDPHQLQATVTCVAN